MIKLFVISALALAVLSSVAHSEPKALRITVAPSCVRNINGYDEVQRVFGQTVNGSLMDQMVPETRALHLNSARAYLWPLYGTEPVTPWLAVQYGIKNPLTADEAAAAWDKWYAQDFETTVYASLAGGLQNSTSTSGQKRSGAVYTQAHQLLEFEKWGLTSGLVFMPSQVDGSSASHQADVDRYFAAYIDAIHRAAPDLHIDFVQFTNEPNYPQWSGQFATTKESVDTWLKVFDALSAYIAKNRPSTRILGPCLASEVSHNWIGWHEWTVPFLARANDIHYFNYHLYDLGSETALAWMEMRQAEGETLRGVRPRAVITETNLLATVPESERFLWHAQHLFSEVENPDKFAIRNYFLYAYAGSFNDSNVLAATGGVYQPTDTYWLYWVLSDLRGKILYLAPTANSQVQAFASAPATNKIVVSLLNNGDSPVDVRLDPGLSPRAVVRAVDAKYAFYRDGVLVHGDDPLTATVAPVLLHLAPHEVRSVAWQLASPVTAGKTLRDTEYYSKTVGAPITSPITAHIHVARLPSDRDIVHVRLGISTDDLLFAKQLVFTVNGKPFTIVWPSSSADVEVGSAKTTHWLELPLPRVLVRADNIIAFGNQDADYRLMFAGITYDEQPTATLARGMEAVESK